MNFTLVRWKLNPKSQKYCNTGDIIKIIEGKRFVRCGYPLNAQQVRQNYREEVLERTTAAAAAAKIERNGVAYQKLVLAVCCAIMKEQGFGGRSRTIHEEEHLVLTGEHAVILGKRFVMTGIYRSGYTSYYGPDDDEPPSLESPERECIYLVKLKNKPVYKKKFEIWAKRCVLFSSAPITTFTGTNLTAFTYIPNASSFTTPVTWNNPQQTYQLVNNNGNPVILP